MSFSLNKIQLIGNLGQDSETTFTTNNTAITKYSVATTHNYKKDGEWEKETTWHNVVSFNLSDFYKDYLKKGAKVFIEGRLSKRSYEKDGVKQYFTEVVSNQIIPLNTRDEMNQEPQTPAEDVSQENSQDDLPF